MRLLLLTHPSANQVYASQVAGLAAAELTLCVPGVDEVAPTRRAGVDYLSFRLDEDRVTTEEGHSRPDADTVAAIARHSAFLALFQEIEGPGAESEGLLRPVATADPYLFDDDLLTIPKYYGKTNEQFTRLLLNVTLSAMQRPLDDDTTVLDPLCGRGTTLSAAWMRGLHAAGVEVETKSVEQLAAFLKTYLRRKRIRHKADMSPVRRDGKALGKRLDATATFNDRQVRMGVFTGDTRSSAKLWGKKKFDAVVTDAPYGVAHGSRAERSDVVGTTGKRDRSAAGLLKGAVGVWASQLKEGGALGVAWNTLGLPREDLVAMIADTGLTVHNEGPWLEFAHRVDSSIHRDVVVATR